MKPSSEDIRRHWNDALLAPLWESVHAHREAEGGVPAHIWHWAQTRPMIEWAFQEQSPAAVQRRVLQLLSPDRHARADEFTCGNVLAAFQCLLPGETARPHRHTMNALRFMLEGSGVVTLVDGKECPMAFGDLVLTPGMCWHEHRHDGTEPVVWLDVLDVPLHMTLGTVVFQLGPVGERPVTMPDACFASPNIVPQVIQGRRDHSPVFRYPYADAVAALRAAPHSPDGARRIRYVNPLTGGNAMALLDTQMLQVDAGVTTTPLRTNASQVCAVIDGEGESRVGAQTLRWKARDVFTSPQGRWASHQAMGGDARLFIVSDADVLRRLGLLTEQLQDQETVR